MPSPASRSPPLLLLVPFLLLLLFSAASAWKKDEFRNCNQTPFCKRARGRKAHSVPSLSTADISISDGAVVARLLPSQPLRQATDGDDPESDTVPPRPLLLRISVYQGGVLRLHIDEDASAPRRRFQVPDVLLPDLDDRRLWLSRLSSPAAGSSSFYLAEGFEAVLVHDPFQIQVRRKGSGEPVLSFNSHGLFDFEQLRAKKNDDEDWEERFRGHTDTRPHGPQSISFDISFHGADFVYGIPEHASTSLALRPTSGPGVEFSEPYRLFNLDVFEYLDDSPFGLYGSIPFMLSHGARSSSGFFWLNAAEMQIDVLGPGWDDPAAPAKDRIDTVWMSEAGVVDAFFFVGHEPKDVLRQYTGITGTPAMPQEFAVAYHQCRWNYRDEEDVAAVDAGFDEHDIPYDVLWLDIEHTDGKRYFTWDRVLFPNPQEMQGKLAAKGRHMVTIVDPHIKRDDSFYIHKEASERGYYVKDASGKDFDGWCWPGSSSYLDVLNPEIREWWAEKFSFENYVGSTPSLYIWNDMNEPSVFNGPEISMPRDAIHFGDVEHRELHNAYGYYFHMATSNGLLKRGNGKDRPFVLSRAFFAGSQRYGAVWTGDNTADWDHLRASVPMILTLGLTGMTFSGADVGGFFGNPEPELLVRWYQLGAYYPFFRAHAHQDTKRREPWLFGERNTALIREAVHVRYSLLPYYYTLFREASVSGIPVMRPLWLEFPADKETYNNGEAFMVGPSLLVQGIYEERQKSVSVYLPAGQSWYNLRNGVSYAGGVSHKLEVSEDSIPTFQRAGTIIPRKDRFRRSSTQMVNDPYTLVIALNGSFAAEGELYVDDGKTYDFEQGAYIHRRFIFADLKLTSVNIHPANLGGKFPSDCVIERIVLLGLPSGAKKAVIEPGNREANVELGPLTLRGGSSPDAITVRKPNVHIADDWTLRIL
ncbi:probable glucan 1,3-alpha-glucosidase [Elaeis guineensis]|uniref:Probable glucan 1,3-alpha-glucosidase n=1 Tax=Elaeis guineensis var. tenera TaxID=51953 RepID=A0A6I9QBR3_ELAGV|nr:probable glucan 1,3-alpha-glucosidase [Elaeis guineensis]